MSIDQWESDGGYSPPEEDELTLILPRRAMERLFAIARFTHIKLDTLIMDAFRRLLANGKDTPRHG